MGVTTPAARRTLLIKSGRRSGERFGQLLLVLVASYVLSAFTTGTLITTIQIVLFVLVALLALRSEGVRRRTAALAIVMAVVGSATAITLTLTHAAAAGAGVASIWTALILLYSVVLIVRRVLLQPDVTLQSIYGAVSAYMIIGLMFAAIYGAMYRFGGNAFFAQGTTGSSKTLQYFSFSTLTTLGYGDFTAAASGGQAVAVVEAMVGQIFLATLVARLVAAFRSPHRGPQHQQPAQDGVPQNGPGEQRTSAARRWRPPPTSRQRRLLAGRQPARIPPLQRSSLPDRTRPGHR